LGLRNHTTISPHPHSPTPPDSPLPTPPLNLKSTRFFQTALTSSLILIPFPPGFLKNVHLSLSPQILSICHSLLVSCTLFRKESVMHKKSTLDKDQLSNYRPISNLSLISKITERVKKSRITDYPTSNKLLNPHQFAYCKHHSTETSLLYIHDHLINAIGSQKLSCLCHLDLSAAFDTIDHSTLLIRLSSWFGIHGSVLNWYKSYLSSRSFCVRCNNTFSSLCTSSCGVPQGSVLGPLLFVIYTTPLSTLISSLSLNHHLNADDTQLFFSFYPHNFDSCIIHLQNALQQISSWMTANLLTLNSSKTKFLLNGLRNQLDKIHNSSS